MCYLAASLGVLPSPAFVARWIGRFQSGGERFPCEGGSCGCASAKECWSSCCCTTEVERLAWAIRNNIEPPKDVSFSTATWDAALKRAGRAGAHCSLCIVQARQDIEVGARRRSGVVPPAARAEERAPATADALPCLSPLDCKGLDSLVLASLPLPLWPGELQIVTEGDDWCEAPLPTGAERCTSRALPTDSPPPRA